MKTLNMMFKMAAVLLTLSASFSAFAGGGGDGGKILREDQMDERAIQARIDSAKVPVLYALHRLEMSLVETPSDATDPVTQQMYTVREKLFLGEHTIYQALDDAKFHGTYDPKDCKGSEYPDPDACANKKTGDIHFILPVIKKETKSQSGNFQIIGLVAHEVSHLVDTSESEAILVQTLIQTSTSSSIYNSAASAGAKYKDRLESILGNFEPAESFLQQLPPMQFCLYWSGVASQIGSLSNDNMDYMDDPGILITDLKNTMLYEAANLKASNLLGYCGGGIHFNYDNAFSAQGTISIADAWKLTSGSPNSPIFGSQLPKLVMHKLDPKKKKLAVEELHETQHLLQQVHDSLK